MEEDKALTSEDAKLLAKLKELIHNDKTKKDLSDEEIGLLRDMISVYESFMVFGRFSKYVRNIVIFVGGLLVGWFVLIDNLGVAWHKIIGLFGGN